jgi:phospholipase/carboxylesterase
MAGSNLIICLHGIGASGAQLQPLAASWRARLPDTSFATHDASFRTAYGGHQCFGVDGMQFDPARIQEARAAFDGSIKTVVGREGFDDNLARIALVGVSQGAIVALDAVATGRWKVGDLVAFAGLLPPMQVSPSSNQTPVLLVHGADDRTIPPLASIIAAGQLRPAGFQVELDIERGMGHTISVPGADKAIAFLRRKFA